MFSFPIFDTALNKSLAIIPKFPYLMVNGLKFMPATRPCSEIGDNKYICTEDDLIPLSEETCEEQLLKFVSPTNCHSVSVDVGDIKLQRIKFNTWIVYVRREIILNETCGNSISYRALLGSYILEISEHCIVSLGKTRLFYRQQRGEDFNQITPQINLPRLEHQSLKLNFSDSIDIKHVNLDDVKQLTQKVNNLKMDSCNNLDFSGIRVDSISLATIMLYVMLSLGLSTYLIIIKFKCFTRNNPNDINSVEDNFALNEGGVMSTARSLNIAI